MQSGSMVVSPLPKLQLAIPLSNTTARSPELTSWFISFLTVAACRVVRLAAVSIRSDAKAIRRFLTRKRDLDKSGKFGKEMEKP